MPEDPITQPVPAPERHWFRRPSVIIPAGIGLVVVILLSGGLIYLLHTNFGQLAARPGATNGSPDLKVVDSPFFGLPGQQPDDTANSIPPDNAASQYPEQWVTVAWQKQWTDLDPKCNDVNNPCDVEKVKAGTVTDGPYKGQTVYIQIESGLGASYSHYVMDGDQQVIFAERNIKIRGIDDLPATIAWANTGYLLKQGYVGFVFKDIELGQKVFSNPRLGDFYLSKDGGCLVVELPDHTALAYNIELPFANDQDGLMDFKFSGGAKAKEAYDYTRPTCAALCAYFNFIDEQALQPISRLTEAGTTSTGEKIYTLKDPNDKELQDIYKDTNTLAYYNDQATGSGSYEPLSKNKYSYSQFLAYHPLVYWQDPIGRWVQFRNRRFAIAAEMCKPVIYLYPTETMDVHVEVAPNGGFTKTEPAYNNGWNVRAEPSGALTDKATGLAHSFLFWEGIGLQYPHHSDGFVVAKADVSKFFDQKLPYLGLRGRELTDFKEYWVDRLSKLDQPYVKINFLTRAEFNGIAPLTITAQQKPSTVIRIMMTAQPLDKFQQIAPQQLPARPVRTGFTVVEWGGALLQ